ncbi:MAG: hypothetical protein ACRENT_04820 [Thermodesulfobacteriota bacterium]
MNRNQNLHFYKGRLPWIFFPFIVLGLIVLGSLALLGIFVGAVVGATAIAFMLIRFLLPSTKNKTKRVEDDGRTVVLREDEYEVIEKK